MFAHSRRVSFSVPNEFGLKASRFGSTASRKATLWLSYGADPRPPGYEPDDLGLLAISALIVYHIFVNNSSLFNTSIWERIFTTTYTTIDTIGAPGDKTPRERERSFLP